MSGPLGYESKATTRSPIWRAALTATVLIAGAAGAAAVFVVPAQRAGCVYTYEMQCTSNLKQIGQAILLYANENRGRSPPDLAAVLATQDLYASQLVCGGTNDVATAATRPADISDDLAAGGHCSFVYVSGQGPVDRIPTNDVVAFERPGHHEWDSPVLLGGGQVVRVSDATAADLQRQFDQGVRPIRIGGAR